MATRMYLVELKKKKVLVEARSVEAAIQTATKPMVKSCTIPTPLETARLMREGVEVVSPSVPDVVLMKPQGTEGTSDQPPQGEGVGKLGLQEPPAGEGAEITHPYGTNADGSPKTAEECD